MKENPLEQQQKQNKKVDDFIEEIRTELGTIFDEEVEQGISELIYRIGRMPNEKITFNKSELIKELKKSTEIENKSAFIAAVLKTLEPFFLFMRNFPKEFENIEREIILNDDAHVKLSEVLFTGLIKEGEREVSIHLASATEFIKEKGIENFKQEVEKGLIELGEIIKHNDNIEKIKATSWIVARNPRLIESLGFTLLGNISQEEKEENPNFRNEKRPVAKAFMNREDFLARYGNK